MPMTPWTLVGLAGRPATPWPLPTPRNAEHGPGTRPKGPRHASLGHLVQLYWLPLREYLVRRHRLPVDSAEDILQGFIADIVMERELISRADRDRGKFRTLLLVALDRYLVSQRRKRTAQKRGGGVDTVPFEDQQPSPLADAVAAADRLWARQVLMDACARARQWCDARDRLDLWLVLERRIIFPALDGLPRPSHNDLAEQLRLEGDPDDAAKAAANLQVTAKRLLARCLREIVGQYAKEEEVDDEIRELWATFAQR